MSAPDERTASAPFIVVALIGDERLCYRPATGVTHVTITPRGVLRRNTMFGSL
jgi:hypothetical protein